MNISAAELAAYIDHTLLKADSEPGQVRRLCEEAVRYHFHSVCILPMYARLARDTLADSGVKVCTVIGFPLGGNTAKVKAFETIDAIGNGAEEIDMVLNIGALKSGELTLVEDDIAAVVAAADKHTVKVILETCLLSNAGKIAGCELARKARAAFVKTSTGFAAGGATLEDVRLMRDTVGAAMGVKASGGIRDLATAQAMIEAGANRLGTSSGVAIVGSL